MSTDRETTRIVRSWLEDGVTALPDRVLDAVLDQVPATPQRRSWWPAWRFEHVSTQTKALLAVAAAVVVAFVGFQFLPGGGLPGGRPTPSPAPTPSPTPGVSTRPSPTPPVVPPAGALSPGRHGFRLEGVSFTLDIPQGWESNGEFGIDKEVGIVPTGAGFIMWEDDPDGVFSDPCNEVRAPAVGPSAADLAAAIAAVPGTELASGPTAVTLGGQPGQQVAITIPDNIPCPANDFHLWYDETIAGNARYATATGETIRVWIIEVDGVRVQLDGETFKGAGPEVGRELQSIVESIKFH